MTSAKVDINGWPIWYEKFGTGSEILLLIAGAIGTGRSDFLPQLEGPHALDQHKYTIIAIELPGWGRSRPPERRYVNGVYSNDAMIALKLMQTLGYKDGYSVIGWSEGAKVALLMAMNSCSPIKCVVIMSIFMHVTPVTIAPVLATEDTKNWSNDLRDNYLAVYGSELQTMWSRHISHCRNAFDMFPSGYWTQDLDSIKCPVIILHGDLDALCSLEHPFHVQKQISHSVLHRFPKGGHNFHHKYPAEFKRITENFLSQCNH